MEGAKEGRDFHSSPPRLFTDWGPAFGWVLFLCWAALVLGAVGGEGREGGWIGDRVVGEALVCAGGRGGSRGNT